MHHTLVTHYDAATPRSHKRSASLCAVGQLDSDRASRAAAHRPVSPQRAAIDRHLLKQSLLPNAPRLAFGWRECDSSPSPRAHCEGPISATKRQVRSDQGGAHCRLSCGARHSLLLTSSGALVLLGARPPEVLVDESLQ